MQIPNISNELGRVPAQLIPDQLMLPTWLKMNNLDGQIKILWTFSEYKLDLLQISV